MEGLAGNRVVLYFYTFDVSGGTQYWLNGVGDYDPATNNITFGTLFTTIGGEFGVSFLQTGCNSAIFSYNSILEGFGSNSYPIERLSANNGISCDPDQF